ncbi:MAG TPA: hypothetical protein VMV25_04985 [Steroidobacteraceae bacterium]|nr:hypothetical protein [Steroidobacteraceae bacterium]
MKTPVRLMVGFLGLSLAAVAAAADKPVEATWKKHDLNFSFVGFTSHYSCGGFEDKVDLLLAAAGARADAKVVASCMAPMGGPQEISTAHVVFRALVARKAGDGDQAVPPVQAAWKAVRLRAHSPADLGEGDCELVDQFAAKILPLFTVQDVENHTNCVPHEVNLGSIDLKYRVLAPLPKPKSAAAS